MKKKNNTIEKPMARKHNQFRTYDAQTRKKINKHAVAAITVLPSAMLPSIRMKSPASYNNNSSRQQPKLNIFSLSRLGCALLFLHFISFKVFYHNVFFSHFVFAFWIFMALIAAAKRTHHFQSPVLWFQFESNFFLSLLFKLEHGTPYSTLFTMVNCCRNMKWIIFMIYAILAGSFIRTHHVSRF